MGFFIFRISISQELRGALNTFPEKIRNRSTEGYQEKDTIEGYCFKYYFQLSNKQQITSVCSVQNSRIFKGNLVTKVL
jgi:hypothetical protein